MTALEKTFIGAALVVAIGTGVFEAHQNSRLRDQMKMLQQEQQKTEQQLAALRDARPAVQTGGHFNGTGVTFSRPDSDTLPSNTVTDEIDRALAESTWGGRDAAFERLSKLISSADIPRALAFLAQRPASKGVDTSLFTRLASRWGSEDPNAAIAWANSLQDTDAQEQALVNIIDGWASTSPKAAADYVVTMSPGDLQDACIGKGLGTWSFHDGQAAVQWVTQLVKQHPETKFTDKAVDSVMFWAQGQCPAAIADMLDATGSTNLIQKYGETIGSIWLSRDQYSARTWIEQSSLSDEVKQRLLNRK
jgi:hypothetical protein